MVDFSLLKMIQISLLGATLIFFFTSEAYGQNFSNWDTDFNKKSIDLNSLVSGGPPKDGIPAINKPEFVSQRAADNWLNEGPVQLTGRREIALFWMPWREIPGQVKNYTKRQNTHYP